MPRDEASEPPATTASGRPVVLDRLCRGWSIYQVADGYRFNGDDVLLAREAARAAPAAKRLLDLGAGTGSVGLMWLAQQGPEASLASLEAQEESVELCRRSVARLGLEGRADVRHGDLRDPAVLEALGGPFDVVTANPPYLDPEGRKLPLHPQRRYCYYELRGGVEVFARAAAGQLAVGGAFCMVHMISRAEDALRAVRAAGLSPERRLVAMARGHPKWLILVSRRADDPSGSGEPREEVLEVRDLAGAWTGVWDSVCRDVGAFQLPAPEPQ